VTTTPTGNSSVDSANEGPDEVDTPTSGSDGEETNPTVPGDSSGDIPPVVLEDETEQEPNNSGSDLLDADTSHHDTLTTGASGGTVQPGGDTTDAGATDLTVSHLDTGDGSGHATNTYILDIDPSQSGTVGADDQTVVIAESGDPVGSMTAVDLGSGLFDPGASGSAKDDPLGPPPAVLLVGALDLVRRDLDQLLDDQQIGDPQQDTTNTLIIEEPSNDSGPVALSAATESESEPPDSTVPDKLTVNPTAAERTAAFQKQQAQRIETFTEAQSARVEAFNEQLAEQSAANPLGALVNSAAFVVSELFNTAAVVVTEFVNYISFAVTEFIQGISDWFTAPAVFEGLYGDPVLSEEYWRSQSHENCVLMSVAMMIGELEGESPSEADILQAARTTESVVHPGQMMWTHDTQAGVDVKDAVALLKQRYNIDATITSYDKTQGNLALRAVAFALKDNKAVSVGVHNYTVWNAVEHKPLPEGVTQANHQVVVTGIDFDERVVIINDSGYGEEPDGTNKGKNMRVPLDAFMKAWQFDDYETMIAVKEPAAATSGPASTNISGAGLLVDVA
jgi:hypothetical protein